MQKITFRFRFMFLLRPLTLKLSPLPTSPWPRSWWILSLRGAKRRLSITFCKVSSFRDSKKILRNHPDIHKYSQVTHTFDFHDSFPRIACHSLQQSFMGFLVFFFGASCTAGTLKWMRHKVLCPRQIISMRTWRDILRKWLDDVESLWRCFLAGFFEPKPRSQEANGNITVDLTTHQWSSFLYIYESIWPN